MHNSILLNDDQLDARNFAELRLGRKTLRTLGAVFALMLTTVPAAKAWDTKVFPGTMCKQRGTTSIVNYDGNGRVTNPTNQTVTVICPIVRDDPRSKWGYVQVVVADRSDATDIHCRAYSAQTDGLGWYQTQKTTGFFPNWWSAQTLTFGAQDQERDFGTYYLSCTIPGRYLGYESAIDSYRIDEAIGGG